MQPEAGKPAGGRSTGSVLLLSATQIIGWSTTLNIPAILGRPIAEDLGVSLPTTFSAVTVFMAAMALMSRPMAPYFLSLGARPILTAESICMALTLAALSFCNSVELYFLLWFLIGCFGAMTLFTSAHTRMAELRGADAKRGVTIIMLASGLSGTVGFPIAEALLQGIGWRATILVFAAVQLLFCAPAHFLTGGRRAARAEPEPERPSPRPPPKLDQRQGRLLRVLTMSVSLSGFVSAGFYVVIVELFKAFGSPPLEALFLASALGVLQVSARVLEILFGRNVSGVSLALGAVSTVPIGLAILLLGSGDIANWAFIVVFGMSTGLVAVARATLMLDLFDSRDYGYLTSRMALPGNLGQAAAAPVFVWVIGGYGPHAATMLAFAISLAALGSMLALVRTLR